MSRRGVVLVPVLAAAAFGSDAFAKSNPSVAFFYGKPVPTGELGRFDWVVVEPDNLDARGHGELRLTGVQVFAYLSLGEAAPGDVSTGWILGRNAPWGSVIVDPRAAGWRARVLAKVDALRAREYQGLFLDTLDSYAMVLRGEERRAATAAMAGLVRAIGERHPDVKLFSIAASSSWETWAVAPAASPPNRSSTAGTRRPGDTSTCQRRSAPG